VRGFLSRKDIKKGNEIADAKPQLSNRSRSKLPGGRNMIENKGKVSLKYAKELKEVPDFNNSLVKATEERLGPFLFDKPDSARERHLLDKGPFELDNGAIYHG
jgi:hypothetical protein